MPVSLPVHGCPILETPALLTGLRDKPHRLPHQSHACSVLCIMAGGHWGFGALLRGQVPQRSSVRDCGAVRRQSVDVQPRFGALSLGCEAWQRLLALGMVRWGCRGMRGENASPCTRECAWDSGQGPRSNSGWYVGSPLTGADKVGKGLETFPEPRVRSTPVSAGPPLPTSTLTLPGTGGEMSNTQGAGTHSVTQLSWALGPAFPLGLRKRDLACMW